jgi:hypothetical protein
MFESPTVSLNSLRISCAKVACCSSLDLTPLDFCLWGWIKNEVYKRKVDIRDELLARILDAANRRKKREDQLRRTTRDLHTRVAK